MNRLFFSIISLWLIGILLAPDVCTGDEERYIVLNSWQKGVYTLRQECTHTLLKTIDGDESERDESRLLFTWQIETNGEDDNAEQVFHLKMQRIMMRLRCNGSELVYFDSSNGKNESDVLNNVFANMKKANVTVIFKNGKPVEVKGCEQFWENLSQPASDSEKELLANIANLAAQDNIKQTFESLVYFDSPQKVGIGDTWKNYTDLDIPLMGTKSFEWNCTLGSVRKNNNNIPIASVSGLGSMDFIVNEEVKGNVKMEGEVLYNSLERFPTTVTSRILLSVEKKGKSTADGKSNGVLEVYSGFTKNNISVAKH